MPGPWITDSVECFANGKVEVDWKNFGLTLSVSHGCVHVFLWPVLRISVLVAVEVLRYNLKFLRERQEYRSEASFERKLFGCNCGALRWTRWYRF